jgi:intracellular multiplication protein IcmK
MNKALTLITIVSICLSAWQVALADEQANAVNEAKFQEWLKNNGQAQQVAPPLPVVAQQPGVPPPPFMAAPHKRKRPVLTIVDDDDSQVISPPMSYSQSQAKMLKAAPALPAANSLSNEAFNAMVQQNTPLTPRQVVKLHQLVDESQRAASISPTVPPKPVSSTIMINLSPGATPPAIRLARKHVTSLVFVDSTGSPWPIASFDVGDSKAMNTQWDGKSNILLIQAITPYDDSDLVVRLVGLPTPITLELVPGQRVVDARTDIHVPGIGPNSKDIPMGTPLPNSADQMLLDVLDGIAPPGSKQLTIKGGDCQGWFLGDKMFLRSRLTLLSPGFIGRMTSPDGMIAYELQISSSVLVSQYGQPIELTVEGF